MNTFKYIDTKFLAIHGDLSNTGSGGTAMLRSLFYKDNKKYIIEAQLPSVALELLDVEIIENKIIISSSVQNTTENGVIFNKSFASKTFDIPELVKQEKIEAYAKDNVLIIELPTSNTRSSRDHSNIDINFDDDF